MKNNKIRLLFAGDFCSEFPDKISLSNELVDLFKSCDFKLLNFEGPLINGEFKAPNKTILKQSSLSPQWCDDHGFNLISLANNHAYDYGVEGLKTTIKSFSQSIVLGAGKWDDAYKITEIEFQGVRMGFVSGTASDFAALKDKWTDDDKVGCAWINSFEINKLISLNKENFDYIFVICHGGIEYMNIPLPEWRDRYRELIDLGADVIIASHPHVPQGTELYKNKPIFYSLGNFCFDLLGEKAPEFWNNGLLSIIEIENGNLSYSIVPTIKNGDFIDIDSSFQTEKHLKNLSDILKDDEKYMEQVNSEVLKLYPKYKLWLLSGFNAKEVSFSLKNIYSFFYSLIYSKSKPNLKTSMHQLREESTRWLLTRALKIKTRTDL